MFDKDINFSTEFQYKVSLKKKIITWYSSLHFILPKMTKSRPLIWEISTAPQKLLYCNKSFSRFWTHLDDRPKTLTYRQIPPKSSQAQNNWFAFKETPVYKEECAYLHAPDMNKIKWVRKQLRKLMLWEFFLLYLSLVKVIPETESI